MRKTRDALNATPEYIKTNSIADGSSSRADTLALLAIAAVTVLVHILTNNRYGFHRDELQVLSDARHLDWDSCRIRRSRRFWSASDWEFLAFRWLGCEYFQ